MLVLDTDIFSLLEWPETALAQSILTWLNNAGEGVYTTVISYEEQMRGWMAYLAKAKTVARQVDAYKSLNRKLANFCKIPVLDFDEMAAIRFQELQKAKLRIGVMDMKIAAIVLSLNATLVTRNKQHFKQIENLKLAEWE